MEPLFRLYSDCYQEKWYISFLSLHYLRTL